LVLVRHNVRRVQQQRFLQTRDSAAAVVSSDDCLAKRPGCFLAVLSELRFALSTRVAHAGHRNSAGCRSHRKRDMAQQNNGCRFPRSTAATHPRIDGGRTHAHVFGGPPASSMPSKGISFSALWATVHRRRALHPCPSSSSDGPLASRPAPSVSQ